MKFSVLLQEKVKNIDLISQSRGLQAHSLLYLIQMTKHFLGRNRAYGYQGRYQTYKGRNRHGEKVGLNHGR